MSDTHSYLHPQVFKYFEGVDEIWHAGDIGDAKVADELEAFKPFRAVWGNIDGKDIRIRYPETLHFTVEDVPVMITHIGGYPGKYAPGVKAQLLERRPRLFICGHSHILKVMPDPALNLLHMNPGACGQQGWHKVKTLLRFQVDAGNIQQLEVIELPK
ncbi:metallophosphoesterase family protein [Chitinophaga sp. CB10]|uniref:metallophosphoesterase family protein n=1 Tax=Chitinophaga sp. CB10 TaxID=1891659 RepID=UPI0025B87EBA|nr:metallophosphoesterase family protein [Chitinophaga sp. CB10]